MQDYINLISNVGFPIACCIFLFVQQGKLTKTFNDLSNTLNIMNERIDNIESHITKRKEKSNAKKEEN